MDIGDIDAKEVKGLDLGVARYVCTLRLHYLMSNMDFIS